MMVPFDALSLHNHKDRHHCDRSQHFSHFYQFLKSDVGLRDRSRSGHATSRKQIFSRLKLFQAGNIELKIQTLILKINVPFCLSFFSLHNFDEIF